MYLLDSHNNTISNNTSTQPFHHGFSLWWSDGNVLANNTSYSAQHNDGFVAVQSSGNRFVDNVAVGPWDSCPPDSQDDCGGSGFHLRGAVGNVLEGNEAENYLFGFVAYEWQVGDTSHSNVFKGNVASRNLFGFFLISAHENTLKENTSVRDDQLGFFFYAGSTGNEVTENSSEHNMVGFLFTPDSSDNTVSENTARTNHDWDAVQDGSSPNWYSENNFKKTIGF